MKFNPTEEMKALLRKAGDFTDPAGSRAARQEVAIALELPLRKALMPGDIIGGIFNQIPFDHGTTIEFPLDIVAPGTEKDLVAYTIPIQGALPQTHGEGDYVTVPAYEIGASYDMTARFVRDARWDVVGRAYEVIKAQMVKKMNDDGMHTIIAAAADRNIIVYDSTANSGQFTKRLVSLGKTVMNRNGGGNSSSVSHGELTDMLLSPELIEDIRNWGVDIVDEFTRRDIYLSQDDGPVVTRIFGVNLRKTYEFGEGQEYQNYYTSDIGGSLASGDLELCIGLDLMNNDSFVSPTRGDAAVYDNEPLIWQRRVGWLSTMEVGFAVLDGRRTIAFSA